MKTAVQKLMDDLRKNQDFSIFNNHHINHYLEIEKKQIIEAANWGALSETGERYYEDNYIADDRKQKSDGKKIF